MKSVKGRFLKKLKTIGHVGSLKPDRILHAKASDGFIVSYPSQPISDRALRHLSIEEEQQQHKYPKQIDVEPDVIDVEELMRDLMEDEDDDEEAQTESIEYEDKENVRPLSVPRPPKPPKKIPGDPFRRPDMDSGTLFDPDLLAAFHQAVMDHKSMTQISATEINEEEEDPLIGFDERCPPGGADAVILYTTSLRGIRKTFEDCNNVKFLLESLRFRFFERDVSMHLEFREELWRVLGGGRIIPPRLFIRGRYIGGADDVLGLHEQGKLLRLLKGVPLVESGRGACLGCGGFRFLPCSVCDGSRKINPDEADGPSVQCARCNENGLVVCTLCCC
ncbi:Uncharacterized protein QJS10_CPA08g00040 [Acorus calamus]|uniref:Glutaredoxin domain-containing protein n=1 Tax=Acorus calamus TaxID=4465 RepID=A0AAV9ECD4_ACOCL|nr:Uncharacterized protein QJS10_CPA08g00040 [Acorus calamus]